MAKFGDILTTQEMPTGGTRGLLTMYESTTNGQASDMVVSATLDSARQYLVCARGYMNNVSFNYVPSFTPDNQVTILTMGPMGDSATAFFAATRLYVPPTTGFYTLRFLAPSATAMLRQPAYPSQFWIEDVTP